MTHAVIQSGGKQYLVTDGDVIRVEKLLDPAGDTVRFDEVLMVASDGEVALGAPMLKGVSVEGKVLRHARHPKVFGVKMKPKKRMRKYFGHKQHFTEIEITKISSKS